jgi:TrmH family RNA methyltransferase
LLANIRIVLVATTHPGNIGAVARAMKNMALEQLYLVQPKYFPHADATSRASGASELLSNATVCTSLEQALADCSIVIGASARYRTINWPLLTPRACAEKLANEVTDQQVALVFGRENSGLKNIELDQCQYLLNIPCNADFSSLNLAAAVQVIAYELFLASGSAKDLAPDSIPGSAPSNGREEPLATASQMESYYQHLQQTLADIGFMHPDKSKSIMRRLRRIYNRSELDTKELDILRGILRMAQGNKRSKNSAHH